MVGEDHAMRRLSLLPCSLAATGKFPGCVQFAADGRRAVTTTLNIPAPTGGLLARLRRVQTTATALCFGNQAAQEPLSRYARVPQVGARAICSQRRRGSMGESNRRQFVGRAGALAAAATVGSVGQAAASAAEEGQSGTAGAAKNLFRPPAGPRYRVISDNDYSGDPDGLFQLARIVHEARGG